MNINFVIKKLIITTYMLSTLTIFSSFVFHDGHSGIIEVQLLLKVVGSEHPIIRNLFY